MAENFPNVKKEADIQVQEAQRVPNKINPKRTIPRHIVIKMAKIKERILKAAREGLPPLLVVQWLRIRLAMQGIPVPSLVGELRSHMLRGN